MRDPTRDGSEIWLAVLVAGVIGAVVTYLLDIAFP